MAPVIALAVSLVLLSVVVAGLVLYGRVGSTGRQLRLMRSQLTQSRKQTHTQREFIEQLRQTAWEYRDINPELSTVLLDEIGKFIPRPQELDT